MSSTLSIPATVPGFQVAIARFGVLPTIFDHIYDSAETARSVADGWSAEDAKLGGRKTGDFVVIPALANPRDYVSSAQVRALAVRS